MRPLLGAMSTLVTVLSWPLSSSLSLKAFPSRATARTLWSAEKEWSAMGLWKRWWTSGAAILEEMSREVAIGGALYYRSSRIGER